MLLQLLSIKTAPTTASLSAITKSKTKAKIMAVVTGLLIGGYQTSAIADDMAMLIQQRQQSIAPTMPLWTTQSYSNINDHHLPLAAAAEMSSSQYAKAVLQQARQMALQQREIVVGGCWDYLNLVFNRAGAARQTVFNGSYAAGPYADSSEIQAGDWLYYINHSYHDIEHSGLFIGWVDQSKQQALILSYAGENRREPARYKVYDLSHVYQIIRPS